MDRSIDGYNTAFYFHICMQSLLFMDCRDISGSEGLNTGWDQTVTCYIACVAIVLPGPCL